MNLIQISTRNINEVLWKQGPSKNPRVYHQFHPNNDNDKLLWKVWVSSPFSGRIVFLPKGLAANNFHRKPRLSREHLWFPVCFGFSRKSPSNGIFSDRHGHPQLYIDLEWFGHILSYTGWWFQSPWKILVNWDDYSIYLQKWKIFQTTKQYMFNEFDILTYLAFRGFSAKRLQSQSLANPRLPTLATCRFVHAEKGVIITWSLLGGSSVGYIPSYIWDK